MVESDFAPYRASRTLELATTLIPERGLKRHNDVLRYPVIRAALAMTLIPVRGLKHISVATLDSSVETLSACHDLNPRKGTETLPEIIRRKTAIAF